MVPLLRRSLRQIAQTFKVIPALALEEILWMTLPDEWSP